VSGGLAYLLDTNVLSETRKKKADAGVISFLEAADSCSRWESCAKA
jgi:predicted nucleic acid-binding protein